MRGIRMPKVRDVDVHDPFFTRHYTSIARYLDYRRCQLGLRKGDIVRRIGYKHISKGLNRYNQFLEGDIHQPFFLRRLSEALEVSVNKIKELYHKSCYELEEQERKKEQEKERRWREAFLPHAEILTERVVASPFFVEAFTNLREKYKIIKLEDVHPVHYVNIVILKIHNRMRDDGTLPYYGKIRGFVINFTPDRSVEYDLRGNLIKEYSHAWRPPYIYVNLGRRKLSANELSRIWDSINENH